MAKTFATAKTTAPAAANIALITEREGRFDFVTAANAPAGCSVIEGGMEAEAALAPSGGVIVGGEEVVQAAPAPVVTRGASRERFDADDALISFINANGWADLKTQKILDSLRAQGRACGMSRLNKLLGRDSRGNALLVEAEKA